jgi:hypothetical protein
MTKSSETIELDQSVATATDDRRALLKISNSNTLRMPRNRWVSREHFIRLLLAHHRLVRCDDLGIGLRGLMDPATGYCFYIGEEDLFEPQTA